MYYLIFLGGVILGGILTNALFYMKCGRGYFTVIPYDEDDTGFYKVNIRIPSEQNLLKKDRIILAKENSQD